MTEDPEHPHEHDPGSSSAGQFFSQDFKHTPVGARIPEKVRCGGFCTGTMILQTNEEFVIDFLSTIAPPQQVVARVVTTPSTFGQMIVALQANIGKYEQQFGQLGPREKTAAPPVTQPVEKAPEAITQYGGETSIVAADHPSPSPKPSDGPAPPNIEDVYGQLKLPDELLGGVFANVVMIRHTAEEFCFDFIANFYPRSVVVSRIFFAAGRIPSFLDALSNALRKYRHRTGGQPPA
jgi:hypothetical protein